MLKDRVKTLFIRHILRKQVPISFSHTNQVSFLDAEPLITDKVYCVLNFDDLSPVPDDSKYIGRGGALTDFINIKQEELLKAFPFLGITHFLIPNHLPADRFYLFQKDKYAIANKANENWLSYYKKLSAEYNIEFASHGVYHRQTENLLMARHTEFAYLSYEASLKRLQYSLQLFQQAGIKPIGFRAPGWDMNADLSLIDAIRDAGFNYAGLCSYDGGLNSVKQRISNYHPVMIKGIVNFPDNINIDWPMETIDQTVRKIVDMNGVIAIKGHFSKHTLTNSFSETNYQKLKELVKKIKDTYGSSVVFGTFRDVYNNLEGKYQLKTGKKVNKTA
ncbi:MAG: DUF2334 domain-containing protein [Bacteroidetes bacterium]|nr:DUF2334 domain-containing protein [Bacteroidota bacterium]